MGLINIALANLKVRKVKMGFLVLGILLCLGTLVALYTLTSSLQEQLQQQLEKVGFRFLITPIDEVVSLSYHGIALEGERRSEPPVLPKEYLKKVQELGLPGLDLISPKLVLGTEILGKQVLLTGLDFHQERVLADWWELQGGRFPEKTGELLLGADSATIIDLEVGNQIDLLGQSFQVAGILAPSGGPEDRLIYLDLGELQSLASVDGTSFLELRVQLLDKEGGIESQEALLGGMIEENLPGVKVVRVKDENLNRQELVQGFVRFSRLTAIVVFILSWLMVAVGIMSSVNERVSEIGTLRAIGYRKKQIMKVILWEAGLLSSLGGLLGYLGGGVIGALLIPFLGGTVSIGLWKVQVLMAVLGLSLLVGLSAAYYPAYRAADLDPVQALRQI